MVHTKWWLGGFCSVRWKPRPLTHGGAELKVRAESAPRCCLADFTKFARFHSSVCDSAPLLEVRDDDEASEYHTAGWSTSACLKMLHYATRLWSLYCSTKIELRVCLILSTEQQRLQQQLSRSSLWWCYTYILQLCAWTHHNRPVSETLQLT